MLSITSVTVSESVTCVLFTIRTELVCNAYLLTSTQFQENVFKFTNLSHVSVDNIWVKMADATKPAHSVTFTITVSVLNVFKIISCYLQETVCNKFIATRDSIC
jgi:hypothetical protein